MSIDIASYTPLHNPSVPRGPWVPPVDVARRVARAALDQHASTNTHDADQLFRAAVALEITLRDLLDALDAEEGRTP